MKKSLLVNILLENGLLIDALRWSISPSQKAIYEDKEYKISYVSDESPEDSGPYVLIFQVQDLGTDSGTETFWKIEGYEDSYDETRLYFKTLHQVRPVEKTHLVYEPVEKND